LLSSSTPKDDLDEHDDASLHVNLRRNLNLNPRFSLASMGYSASSISARRSASAPNWQGALNVSTHRQARKKAVDNIRSI
jgi:hypothetical protein